MAEPPSDATAAASTAASTAANPPPPAAGDKRPTEDKSNKMPDFEPPQACVQRIIKSVLPDNCQITKEAKAAFSKAAGIFIIYLTTCANDFCKENKRSTISSSDVLAAIKELEFHDLTGPLEDFLEHYRKELNLKKEHQIANRQAAAAAGAAAGAMAVNMTTNPAIAPVVALSLSDHAGPAAPLPPAVSAEPATAQVPTPPAATGPMDADEAEPQPMDVE